jgi:CO/xanthine dehydrogenase Mo-binding subunit
MGAFASRVTVMTGAAVTIAAAKLRGELLRVAGRLLQTAPDCLAVTGDRVVVCDAPGGPSLDLAAIARGAGGELTAEATFTTDRMTYPYGVHLAQVRLEPRHIPTLPSGCPLAEPRVSVVPSAPVIAALLWP